MTPRCIHGHLYTEANTRWIVKKRGDKTYHAKQCKTCHRNRTTLKYRNDEEFRERQKARTRALYEKHRDATAPRRKKRVDRHVTGPV